MHTSNKIYTIDKHMVALIFVVAMLSAPNFNESFLWTYISSATRSAMSKIILHNNTSKFVYIT